MQSDKTNNSDSMPTPGGVSLIIRHQVQPANQAAYELWLKQIIPAAAKFPCSSGFAPGNYRGHCCGLSGLRDYAATD